MNQIKHPLSSYPRVRYCHSSSTVTQTRFKEAANHEAGSTPGPGGDTVLTLTLTRRNPRLTLVRSGRINNARDGVRLVCACFVAFGYY